MGDLSLLELRDWFAGQALSGMLASEGENSYRPEWAAERAYLMADAMLDMRDQQLPLAPAKPADDAAIAQMRTLGIQNIVESKCTTCGCAAADCECRPF